MVLRDREKEWDMKSGFEDLKENDDDVIGERKLERGEWRNVG